MLPVTLLLTRDWLGNSENNASLQKDGTKKETSKVETANYTCVGKSWSTFPTHHTMEGQNDACVGLG